MKILMVLTSHDKLGNTGERTGFWLEEFAAPYYVFKGRRRRAYPRLAARRPAAARPQERRPSAQTDATRRFADDPAAQAALASTARLDTVKAADFDAVFYPGGHGPLWDLAEDAASIALIEATLAAGKPVAAVCHAPAVLRHPGRRWQAGSSRQGGDRFHQQRRGCSGAHRGGAFPGRGHAQGQRRALRRRSRLGGPRRDRRPAHHRPESGLVRARSCSLAEAAGLIRRAARRGAGRPARCATGQTPPWVPACAGTTA